MLLIKKIFNYFVWLVFFGLLLLGGIIYATDRTYPGDYLYPFKLKFEDFALATSKILNKQVDFSINLVVKRSNETAKILSSRYGKDSLDRLNIQVELTANSISQIADPVEKKKAAEKYIVKLNEVSSVLSEKQKDFVATSPPSNVTPQVETQQVQNTPTPPTEQSSQKNVSNNNPPQNYVNPTATAVPKKPKESTSNIIPDTSYSLPTAAPQPEIPPVIQKIEDTQQIIEQTIVKMTEIKDEEEKENHKEINTNKNEDKKNDKNDKDKEKD